ncbi:MAG TPA: ATP-binding protein [Burkholderiaceae bacterium]
MKPARQSLKRILTRQYVLLACVPLLLVVVLWSAVAIPATLRDIEEENARTALLIRAQVELLISAPREAVARAAARVAPGTREQDVREELGEALATAPALESVLLLDRDGMATIAEVRPGTQVNRKNWEGLDLSRRPFYQRARHADAPVWSETFLSPLTGRITAVVAAPAGGRMVVGDLSLDRMAQQIRASVETRDLAVIVFDSLGRVIVHPDQRRANWQENLSQFELVHRALNGYSGSGEIDFDGQRWLASVAPAATTGWYVLVAQPRNALFAPVMQLAGVVGIAVLVVLVVVVAIALKLAQRQAGNYRQLVSAATDLVDDRPSGPGEPGAEADLGSEEVAALWAQLRRLLDRAKEQERSARHAQAELQALLDAATEVAIIAVDANHVVRLFNRGAEKMLGHRASDMLGRQCPMEMHDAAELAQRAQELSVQFKRTVRGREAITAVAERFGYEVRDWTYLRKDGSRLTVSLAVTAVRAPAAGDDAPQGPRERTAAGEVVFAPGSGVVAPGGDALGFLFVGTDQSERVRSGELELARRRAEAASQAKSEFLSRVSHELRTPMNAMLGYAQLLQLEDAHPLDEHQRERVARIEAAGWHLVTLINDVLDLSTIESGNARIQMADIDVALVINESVRLLAPLAANAKVALAVTLPPQLPREALGVQADATRLRQVLVNVIGNAIKYNLENGRVDVTVHVRAPQPAHDGDLDEETDAGRLVIEIADTGRGMTAAQLARLFSAFDRLGLESSAIEGTGIGLVISRRLVERMGGEIAVDSRPDVGTRVTLTLRRAQAGPLAAAGDAPANLALPRSAGGQIVYVEDNPINALLMQEVVEQRPDCTLHQAVSVRDGIDMIERLRPDLVLVDLHLPDGSGLQVAEWMRTRPMLARVPVVVVSADSTQTQRDAATVAGVRAYLAKPIRLPEALRLIDELLPASA